MRLIDADLFKNQFKADTVTGNTMHIIIDEQPTAYDVDKVVESLENQKSGLTTWAEDESYKLGIEKAIEIVKSELKQS